MQFLFFIFPQLHVALCGKTPSWNEDNNPCSGSGSGAAFLKLLDDFISKLRKISFIEFILGTAVSACFHFVLIICSLDGSFVPNAKYPCMVGRYDPWNCTWVEHPVKALFSNANNSEALYDFQVFNVPIASVPELSFYPYVLLNYGKFSQQSKYPYLVWEPSDQSTINSVSHYYSKGLAHLPQGLRFAINLSMERFEIFNANATGRAWNLRLPNTANATLPYVFNMSNNTIVVIFYRGHDTQYAVYYYKELYQEVTEIVAPKNLNINSSQTSIVRNKTTFEMCDLFGVCRVFVFSDTHHQFSLISTSKTAIQFVYWKNGTNVLYKTPSCAVNLNKYCVFENADHADAVLCSESEVVISHTLNKTLFLSFVDLNSGNVLRYLSIFFFFFFFFPNNESVLKY